MKNQDKLSYEQKGITTSIRFTSRSSLKIGDNFFTVEACEERSIPDIEGVDLKIERELLWDAVNEEVDKQFDNIFEQIKKKNNQK